MRYQQEGDGGALEAAKALLEEAQNLSVGDRERLFGYLEGGGKMILSEPHAGPDCSRAHAGTRRAEDVQVLQQHHFVA